MKKITIAGAGYVGLSNAVLLAQHHNVILLDIDQNKVDLINNKKSPITDKEIEDFLQNKSLTMMATTDKEVALKNADFVIIATPTDYNTETGYFNTSTVEAVIEQTLSINPQATIIIKSTIPVGFTENMREKFNTPNLIFSPEFLREGKALYDNLYPSRIIVGSTSYQAKVFADMLTQCARKKDVTVLFTHNTEAEAVKLFANTYLAMRVAFFNELDTYASLHHLNTKDIINGISTDPRIGTHYNNPSFGYGGYCLPKDTKQLLANYADVPQNLIEAIVKSNETRKRFITHDVLNKKPKTVGIYRLIMKSGSDNFRASAILDIMPHLKENGVEIVIYEPTLNQQAFEDYPVINQLSEFINRSDVILANRSEPDLNQCSHKIYTRDIFGGDA
ncbi:UDPglucose 6-dehydrogenase [Pasteurella multocida]|uniref:UDP-glucose 6-dehydrogenase n=3 Tax=Pasteurella multocida TaxID=747 RepID=Q9CMN9_PASMU|nr:nucleotide sugar dehydrogenase [Pasteurella multocida]AAK02860.1 unknown [Pasteurella multocida subsp. multocida str. Pm70]AFI45630.1 UDP-glucose 6-dehydrogenase [Pasteurella multocida subsp. multocida str. 3480]APW55379.1 UDP-glucose 6-dehydrogenase [Pasteurella multocida subsp. multocida str. HN07]ARA69078.1 UDP-glucose 6-dehydrogenase [Pasteurella multocida subsp. multocida]ARA89103.1 UDP-glucose 6-dehydrogenase [Pasteurella multocida subsp. septica]